MNSKEMIAEVLLRRATGLVQPVSRKPSAQNIAITHYLHQKLNSLPSMCPGLVSKCEIILQII